MLGSGGVLTICVPEAAGAWSFFFSPNFAEMLYDKNNRVDNSLSNLRQPCGRTTENEHIRVSPKRCF